MLSSIHRTKALFSPVQGVPKMQVVWLMLVMLLLAVPSMAQQEPQTIPPPGVPPTEQSSPQTAPQSPPPGETTLTLPPGTQLALILTHPVDSKTTHRGDQIYGQTTAPVIQDNQVAIPAGVFVQAKVEKLARHGTRADLMIQSVSLIFPDGYVVNVNGPIEIRSEEGTAWNSPSSGAQAGAIAAPMIGLGLGALIGSAAHTKQTTSLGGMTMTSSTPKGLAIGSTVGLAAGGVVSLVLLARSHHFYMEVGSPMGMVLPRPVKLEEQPAAEGSPNAGVQSNN